MPVTDNRFEIASGRNDLRLTIQFAVNAVDQTEIPSRLLFRKWVKAGLNKPAEIVIRIVGRHEGETLNHNFRGKRSATNVLTFVYADEAPLSGDIVLCAPVIWEEAQQQGKNLVAHYAHLTIHGVLHLQGYDHVSDRDAAVMESLETEIITRLGYADPYFIQ